MLYDVKKKKKSTTPKNQCQQTKFAFRGKFELKGIMNNNLRAII